MNYDQQDRYRLDKVSISINNAQVFAIVEVGSESEESFSCFVAAFTREKVVFERVCDIFRVVNMIITRGVVDRLMGILERTTSRIGGHRLVDTLLRGSHGSVSTLLGGSLRGVVALRSVGTLLRVSRCSTIDTLLRGNHWSMNTLLRLSMEVTLTPSRRSSMEVTLAPMRSNSMNAMLTLLGNCGSIDGILIVVAVDAIEIDEAVIVEVVGRGRRWVRIRDVMATVVIT